MWLVLSILHVIHVVQRSPHSVTAVCAHCRGTSVYLVQRRIDMLPKPLTEDICSLRANVDRLAFSVLWELTLDGELIGCRFTKSIIRCLACRYPRESFFTLHFEKAHLLGQ